MASPDRDYLDARFDGLEKLVKTQADNTTAHINAVSSNVREIRADFQVHKDSHDAHGAGAAGKGKSEWLSIVAVIIACGVAVMDLIRGKH